MPNLGVSELLVIFMILVLVFGASRLPQLGEGLGKAMRSFKRGLASDDKIQVTPARGSSASEEAGDAAPKPGAEDAETSDAELVDKS